MSLTSDLEAAKRLIDTPEKWLKGDYSDAHGRRCMMGAVSMVTADQEQYHHSRNALRNAIPEAAFPTSFNDADDTTHDDIMAVFDRAIAASKA